MDTRKSKWTLMGGLQLEAIFECLPQEKYHFITLETCSVYIFTTTWTGIPKGCF